jgi:hypothetical protein
MNFSEALAAIKDGKKLTRSGWNGKGMYVAAQFPDANSANTKPYIYIVPVGGGRCPWVAAHSDLFAEDWGIVEMFQGSV